MWYERLIVEKQELDEKLGKLDTYLKAGDNAALTGKEHWELLVEQLRAMTWYSEILNERIKILTKNKA